MFLKLGCDEKLYSYMEESICESPGRRPRQKFVVPLAFEREIICRPFSDIG